MDIRGIIEGNIEFLKDINDEEILGNELSKSINDAIMNIEKYYNNQEVKLAVLGEFSSGKSTLINALLKENILSHSNLPTTAVNTYIKYGDNEGTWVWIEGEKKKISDRELFQYVKEGNIKYSVEKIEIIRKNQILKNNLVIIDTPGANSGVESHDIQWNNAIIESNAAIFVISAQRLTSKTFIDFLNDNKEHLGKFIFVINKCDTLDDEIDDSFGDPINNVVRYVSDVIKKETGITTNRIFPISAIQELLGYNNSVLKNNFIKLEQMIYLMMERDRELMVLFKILDIQKQIFNQINDITGDRKKLFQLELEKLKGEEIDIVVYRKNILEMVKKVLENDVDTLKRDYYGYHDEAFRDCERRILYRLREIKSVKELKENGPKFCSYEVYQTQKLIDEFLNTKKEDIETKHLISVRSSFKQYFKILEKMYKELHIGKKQNYKLLIKTVVGVPAVFGITYLITSNIVFSVFLMLSVLIIIFIKYYKHDAFDFDVISYTDYTSSAFGSERFNSVLLENAIDSETMSEVGAGGGFVVGTLIGGPLVGILGGIVGSIIGGLFGTDLETLKTEYFYQVVEKLNQVDEELKRLKFNEIDKFHYSVLDNVDNYINNIIKQYNYLIDKIMETQFSKKSKLEKINNDLIKIGEESMKKISFLEEAIRNIKIQLGN